MEIKTGRPKGEYHGQVIIYGLMLAERFKTQASEENLLVYTKEDNILNSNVVVRNNKDTLDAIMLIRNRIAKWQKINNTPLKYPEQLEDLEKKIA